MIKLNIDNNIIEMKSEIKELTIDEFQKLTNIFNDNTNEIKQWKKIISLFSGISEEVIGQFKKSVLYNIIENAFLSKDKMEFNFDDDFEIEINNNVYNFPVEITADDLDRLMDLKNDTKNQYLMILAIVSKLKDSQIKDYYSDKHLFKKIEDLKTMSATVALPIIDKLYLQMGKDVEKIMNLRNEVKTVSTDIINI